MDGAVIDLDGTVYRSSQAVPGAPEAIATLRDRDVEVVFVSNTSKKSRETCRDRLREIGIAADIEDVVTSASVTAAHVASTYDGRTALAIGSDALLEELSRHGVATTDDVDEAEIVVVGKDTDFDYDRLTRAVRAVDGDAPFVVTNRDRASPTAEGLVPGTGTIVAAISWGAGREPDVVAGKPHEPMVEATAERLDAALCDAVMIGDNVETDIQLGERAGMETALVLSGLADGTDLPTGSVQPDHVIDSLADVESVLWD